ncbi:MAG: ROK family transcriptional regulator [Cellulomonas sp.]|nr:ROK family transcriptional regulator [Actinomycetota bacterium]MCG2798027.1 ROK family transcriptional regulator [Cellulomonas sp.]
MTTRATQRPRRPAGTRARSTRGTPLTLVLAHVLASPDPVARAQVAAATGLSAATVSVATDQLVTAGLLRELDPVPVGRAGRPAAPLAPARGTVAGIGMEVNVDYLGVRAMDLAGRVLRERVVYGDLRGRAPGPVLDQLADLAGQVVIALDTEDVRVAGTALALPGLVDRVTGPLRLAPNLGWRDVDVLGHLAGHPVLGDLQPRLGNEANLAARAEANARRGAELPSFLYVSGEVGIGAGVVVDGVIAPGRHGWSGEIGQMVVRVDLGTDGGTLEQLVGQDALLRGAGLAPGRPVGDLVAALAAGEPRATSTVGEAARVLGYALASAVNVVDVDEVVLGGSFGALFDHLHAQVEERLAESVLFAPWAPVRVSRARGGDLPAMTGGALAVLAQVIAHPEVWVGAPG